MKVSRNQRIAVLVWATALAALAVGLPLTGASGVLIGGALGAFCGATIAVLMVARERKAAKNKPGSSVAQARYGRR